MPYGIYRVDFWGQQLWLCLVWTEPCQTSVGHVEPETIIRPFELDLPHQLVNTEAIINIVKNCQS